MFTTWTTSASLADVMKDVVDLCADFASSFEDVRSLHEFLATASQLAMYYPHRLTVGSGEVKFYYYGNIFTIETIPGGWYFKLQLADATADTVADAILLGWDMDYGVAGRCINRVCEKLLAYSGLSE